MRERGVCRRRTHNGMRVAPRGVMGSSLCLIAIVSGACEADRFSTIKRLYRRLSIRSICSNISRKALKLGRGSCRCHAYNVC